MKLLESVIKYHEILNATRKVFKTFLRPSIGFKNILKHPRNDPFIPRFLFQCSLHVASRLIECINGILLSVTAYLSLLYVQIDAFGHLPIDSSTSIAISG